MNNSDITPSEWNQEQCTPVIKQFNVTGVNRKIIVVSKKISEEDDKQLRYLEKKFLPL